MTDQPDPRLDNPLWFYAVALYGRPGVADELITLQDEFGIDVAMILFCGWLGQQRGIRMTPDHLAQARRAAEDWHQRVVRPLRAMRRLLKAEMADMPAAALRTGVKANELLSEQIELAALADLSANWLGGPGSARLARANIALALDTAGAPQDLVQVPALQSALEDDATLPRC
jgi:uncharacterized protein (TIGR02444 family)